MNRYRQVLIFPLLLVGFAASGQGNLTFFLNSIDENNPTIVALRARYEMEKAEARTDLLPPNPTAEIGRFPAARGSGAKSIWGVSQSFDFPTSYAKRKKLASASDAFFLLEFHEARQEILLQAKITLLEQLSLQKMLSEARGRQELAKSIEAIIEKKVLAGHTSILDLNNARVRTTEAAIRVAECEGRLMQTKRKLLSMNGMRPFQIYDTLVFPARLPSRDSMLRAFTERDTRLRQSEAFVNVANAKVAVVRYGALPGITVGYESERTETEHFQGFKAGISIPLWGNSGMKRLAKAQLLAANATKAEKEIMLLSEFDQGYARVQNLWEQLHAARLTLEQFGNINLLQRAVGMGEISVGDFYSEASFLFQFIDRTQELELELAKAIAALTRFEL